MPLPDWHLSSQQHMWQRLPGAHRLDHRACHMAKSCRQKGRSAEFHCNARLAVGYVQWNRSVTCEESSSLERECSWVKVHQTAAGSAPTLV